ncbi:unnamed protein product [Candidula unifasciata]|uniref:dolichyl-phosphate-mannose--protein mannosyltransferase n=1 Tax=Candidula unifasciata TaxID=100452 RepID=A0A8S3YTV6_9EUPU|nr:unnamed protein product [Candidula unifasciata]
MDYAPVVTAVLAFLLYLNTLPADFAYDDSRAILKNPDLLPETPIWNLFYDDFWGTPLLHSGSHKSYRPLCVLTFRLNYMLGGLNPWGYHLGNVICHTITTALFTILARLLLVSHIGTFTAGLLFAAHPIHTEARLPRLRWPLSGLLFVLTAAGMLNKEQALTVLAVCATYDVFVAHRISPSDVFSLRIFTQVRFRPAFEGLLLLTVYGLTLLSFRIYFMGNKPPEFAPSDNPASDSDSLLTRILTYNYLPMANFWMMLCPSVLSFDWSMEAVPLLESFSDMRNNNDSNYLITVKAAGKGFHKYGGKSADSGGTSEIYQNIIPNCNGSLNASKHSKTSFAQVQAQTSVPNGKSQNVILGHPYQSFISASIRSLDVSILSIAIIVFPFIPASNLFFYVGFVIAERILYIPSMGVCLLVGLGVEALYRRWRRDVCRRLLLLALAGLVLAFSARTVLRNLDWQSEERLYSSGIRVNPAKAWGNLANIFNDKHETDKAEEAYKKALTYRPNMADVHYNLGVLLQTQNRVTEALESYRKAIHFRPKLSVAHLNLGILTAKMGDTEQAKKIYSHCADLDTSGLKDPRLHDGTKISCLFNQGRLLMDEDRLQEALEIFNKALQKRPDHYSPQSIYNMIGEVYFKLDQLAEAEKWYREALKVKPDHLPAYLTMSKLYQAKNLFEEAEKWLDRAKEQNPSDLTVDFHRAQLFASMKRFDDAVNIFERILPHMSQDFDVVYNAASAYRCPEKAKAEEMYIAATKLKPNEPAAWMNLGAMLHINNKYEQAERAYLRGLELRPNDKVTLENLQRLRKLKQKHG